MTFKPPSSPFVPLQALFKPPSRPFNPPVQAPSCFLPSRSFLDARLKPLQSPFKLPFEPSEGHCQIKSSDPSWHLTSALRGNNVRLVCYLFVWWSSNIAFPVFDHTGRNCNSNGTEWPKTVADLNLAAASCYFSASCGRVRLQASFHWKMQNVKLPVQHL